MAIDAAAFRHALGHFASGVTVVTMAHDGQLSGLTVSAFCSLSLNPPYVLACIDKSSSTLHLARHARAFAVNILSDQQSDLSNHFASKMDDKLSSVRYRLGPLGSPLLDGVLVKLECKLAREVDGGDHIILIGEVVHAEVSDKGSPLLYYAGHYGEFQSK
ncbi:flavin reductase family protein [Alicyclobacillus fastidiosus]|uniref:Flavin reductase family protein n=1 Tax=Alicyclobacillus fastidiosus TaxID=392011 RepID=A0ABY6ZM52_9BACL|nr:flavin reductase family protein [Alicyclobacillus fastidiosus]WAH43995.1 flavin reductase family protein [Alicyclobacillus fastidiosus]GMA60272.1 flavin reductase [Alicyclobacillus fastidiosus]